MRSKLLALSGLALVVWSNGAPAQTVEGYALLRPTARPLVAGAHHGHRPGLAAKTSQQVYIAEENGVLATVDLSNDTVNVVGNTGEPLTDIAFAPDGTLYGITFSSLYRIDTDTAAATFVANLTGGPKLNALFIAGNGVAYAEAPNDSNLYSLDMSTGAENLIGSSDGYLSAGDITSYSGTSLLMSTSDAHNDLVTINPSTGSATNPVALSVRNMYGLASPAKGKLFGFAGTSLYQIFPNANSIKQRTKLLADLGKLGVGLISGAAYDGNFGSHIYHQLYAFSGGDGRYPFSGLLLDGTGNLYGTTQQGGTSNYCGGGCGTVFTLAPNGKETVLYSFCSQANCTDGGLPRDAVIEDKSGNLYGTTQNGGGPGWGTVYELATDGTETVLYSFCSQANCADGGNPHAGLIADSAGNFYGNALSGGNSTCTLLSTCGVVFELTSGGNYMVLHSFSGTDGANPFGNLVLDGAGNIFGTTYYGGNVNDNCGAGSGGCGATFEIAPDGTETTFYSFTGGTGSYPEGQLALDKNGNLYGTATYGGSSSTCGAYVGCGIVFKLTQGGTETIMYPFNGGTDGGLPSGGLVADSQGNLYGTTFVGGGAGCGGNGCGTVFKIAPDTKETILYVFQGGTDGAYPNAGLIIDSKGNLYGTTYGGGGKGNGCSGEEGCGTVFELAVQSK